MIMFDWVQRVLPSIAIRADRAAQKQSTQNDLNRKSLHDQSIDHKQSGDALLQQGQFSAAKDCYLQALACNPDFAEACVNLSIVFRELGHLDQAEILLRKATALKPNLHNVHYNLASLLLSQARTEESIAAFAEELKHHPTHYAALSTMLHQKRTICDWRNFDSLVAQVRRAVIEEIGAAEQVISPFTFIALPGTTANEQKRCAQRWAKTEFEQLIKLRPTLGLRHNSSRYEKLTVGYLSGDYREHPVAKLLADIIELHDRDCFRVHAYSYGVDDHSPIRKRLERAFDKFVDIRSLTDIDAARRINVDNVDILVDLTGYTKDSRSGILALRPAPCQVNFLGYPGTMGADFVDYILADRFVAPSQSRDHYTEKLAHLPNCFFPTDSHAEIASNVPDRTACELPQNGMVFCCFNRAYKITPQIFAVWMRLLKAVPNSVLWLSDNGRLANDNLRIHAKTHGIDPGRIVFAAKVKTAADHLARHKLADLFLDTSPYNAHTTCLDALWAGLPVVTCSGDTFTSRVAGSLLNVLGMPELITYDLEAYYQLALALAKDRRRLAAARDKLTSNRDSSPLFDSVTYTRDLEQLFSRLFNECTDPIDQGL